MTSSVTLPAAPPRTNTLAVVAFVLAFFVSLAAVICGHIALGQIRRTGEGGRAFAIWALVLGYAGLLLGLLWIVVILALLAGGAFAGSSGY